MLSYIAGLVLSLLPERYRRRWWSGSSVSLHPAAFTSGLAQFLGCLLIFILRYVDFFQRRVQDLGGRMTDAAAEELLRRSDVQYGMGFVTTLEYALQPLSLLLVYFALEGAVRLCGAAFTEEILGTLPLHVVAWAHERVERVRAERALGPRVADTVERGDGKEYDVRIASCRPKSNWDRLVTVAFEEEFYEVVKEEQGSPPRRFVYLLRKMPPGKVIRGLHHYRPDESLENQ
ncbi:MAG: hypothetical protein ACE5HL_04180 [Terriglobia bacterium]